MSINRNQHIFFPADIASFCDVWYPSLVLHVVCTSGSMTFEYQNTSYTISKGDMLIITDLRMTQGFSLSDDFDALLLAVSEPWFSSLSVKNDYGIMAGLSLFNNPVLNLSDDYERICNDINRLKEVYIGEQHTFQEEILEHLLMAHVLDLYHIIERQHKTSLSTGRSREIMRGFFALLASGEFRMHRNLAYYADKLCITQNHLGDVCKEVSSRSAGYWIDIFTIHEVARLLNEKDKTLKDISDTMNFSSLSYFSRYVSKTLGVSPKEFRQNVQKRKNKGQTEPIKDSI